MLCAANETYDIKKYLIKKTSYTPSEQCKNKVKNSEAIDLTTTRSVSCEKSVLVNNDGQSQNDQSNEVKNDDHDENLPMELSSISLPDENSVSTQQTLVILPTNDDSDDVDYFKKPKKEDSNTFLNYHSKQCAQDNVINKVFSYPDKTQRKWITFITGFEDRQHIHDRVKEHEKSKFHQNCVGAYYLHTKNADLPNLLNKNLNDKRREEVMTNRKIIESVIDVIKLIGKCQISYRGNKKEAAYSLKDIDSHGNFLEILLLLSKHNPILKDHIDKCIDISEAKKASKPTGKIGRGNFVTMISKTTVNNILSVIVKLMKLLIAEQINSSEMFTIQIDSTQDITVQDQCSIIIRYIYNDQSCERLLSVVRCQDSSGLGLTELVMKELELNNIDVKNCIGSSTEGAANMIGEGKGFRAWLSKEVPESVHVWCYAHVLNLVISDTISDSNYCASLFGLLNKSAAFFKESYLRMEV
uniref:DUF4371 domain-containing protein n=1 Tax=Trichogramma kaykai TaxID=54128 RepID=A0ABD2X297_9HYME